MLNHRRSTALNLLGRIALLALLAAVAIPALSVADQPARRRGGAAAADDKKPAPPPVEHFARPRSFDVQHLECDLEADFAKQSINVTVEHTLTAVVPAINEVTFDQVGFEFHKVTVDGKDAEFRLAGETIVVPLGRWLHPGEFAKVALAYTAKPKNGMFFLVNDGVDPDASSTQLHTQGEPELNHHWLCCYDFPNDKTTTEMTLTVPAGMVGLSNGKLIDKQDLPDGRSRFHWKEEIAMATYLITVVIGEFTAVTDKWDNLPLTYWVPPSAAPIARNTFGNTPLIMDFFCNAFGVRYPWPKYDQTIIWRFRYGGMENTSITNMTSHLLHDQVAHDDGENSDSIVAHEMAHQWFGDMVTMRSWPHLWLNEGFATYSESLWAEHNTGADSMMWRMDRNRGAFGWADNRNPEPIVRHNYGDPHQLFDGRTYQKGSWVLHMLRNQIGDEKFFETLRQYIEAYRGPDKNPVTNDFRRMAERVSGQDLGYFFTQWVYRGGWPKLDVSWKYEDGKAWVTVKQTQKVQDMWPLFAFPLMLGFVDAEGQETGHKVNVSRAEETFVLPMKVRPVRVRVDPGHRVLRELDMHQSDENWAEQLVYDADVVSRREALQHFNEVARGKDTSPEDRQRSCAMVLAAVDSPFAPLSEEAMDRVRSLVFDGKWVDDKGSPLAPLLHSWLTKNVHTVAVRAAALETLGRLSFAPAAGMIRELALNGDKKSYTMHAAALRAVAHLDADKALPTLRLALNFDSHRDEVRRAALDGICTHALEEGLELAAQFAQYGHGHHLRNHALDKLDDHLGDPAFEALFLRLLKDPDWRIRRRVAGSLGERAWSDHVIAVLDECAKTDPDPYPRDAMAGAANRLRERRKQAEAK